MRKSIVSIALLLTGSFLMLNAQEPQTSNKLEQVWEITDGLDVPESAHYNTFNKIVYVSSIVGKHDVTDGVGYISKVSPDGRLIEKEWLKDLNAPKGMFSNKSKLYVTDYDRVLEVDLKSGSILKEFRNNKSKDLNDVAIASDGSVYITDSGSKCLFRLENDSMVVFMEDDRIKGMNGIYIENDTIIIGAQNKLLAIDIDSRSVKVIAHDVGYVDGIKRISENQFVTSDWKGAVRIISIGEDVEKVMDTSLDNIYAADLEYIQSKNLILIPTFSDNRLIAYKINKN